MGDLIILDGATSRPTDAQLHPGLLTASPITLEGRLDIVGGTNAASFLANTVGKLIELTAGTVEISEAEIPPFWTYKASDYAVPGRTTYGLLICTFVTNAAAPAAKLEPTLFSITSVAGATKKIKPTVAAVANSGALLEPALETITQVRSTKFPLVDGTTYTIGLVNPKTTAATSRSNVEVNLALVRA